MSSKISKKKKEEQKSYKSLVSVIAILIGVLVIGGIAVFMNLNKKEDKKSVTVKTNADADFSLDEVQGPIATISVKGYGDIKVQLDEMTAPITVENFVTLAKNGFYDGLTFHRIINGFMIQGGDPLGNGTGGSDKNIKGEFLTNGVNNRITHNRGVISMARSSSPDSASSQFFIVQSDSKHLDGQYAGFGYVLEGMEYVDQICKDVPVQDANGKVDGPDQPIIESVTIEE